MKRIDITTGERFGNLVVIGFSEEKSKEKKKRMFECKCDCGKIAFIEASQLKHGICISCGCKKRERFILLNQKDNSEMVGRKFGKLTVIERDETSTWKCKCDCGKIVSVATNNLTSGNNISCGCKRHEGHPNLRNIIGQKFGKLTVLSKSSSTKSYTTCGFFVCRCDCGSITEPICGKKLRDGDIVSCGCDKSEKHIDFSIIGKKFGKLTVLSFDKIIGHSSYWKCKCDCGNEVSKKRYNITSGKNPSCGCAKRECFKPDELIGQKFGKLTVISFVGLNKFFHSVFKCKCDCGNETDVQRSALLAGSQKTCGCGQHTRRVFRDLVGQKFSRLTVLENIYKNGSSFWKCKCDCGNESIVVERDLLDKRIHSCGCLKSKAEEQISKILKENNITFTRQFSFEDLRFKRPLRFDFKVSLDDQKFFLLEFNGKQHYFQTTRLGGDEEFRKIQLSDKMKKEYCEKHSFKLETLTYEIYDKLEAEVLKLLNSYNLL